MPPELHAQYVASYRMANLVRPDGSGQPSIKDRQGLARAAPHPPLARAVLDRRTLPRGWLRINHMEFTEHLTDGRLPPPQSPAAQTDTAARGATANGRRVPAP